MTDRFDPLRTAGLLVDTGAAGNHDPSYQRDIRLAFTLGERSTIGYQSRFDPVGLDKLSAIDEEVRDLSQFGFVDGEPVLPGLDPSVMAHEQQIFELKYGEAIGHLQPEEFTEVMDVVSAAFNRGLTVANQLRNGS